MKSYAQAAADIEKAYWISALWNRRVSYGHFLRTLPDYVLSAIAAVNDGHKENGSLLALATMRVGAMLQGKKRTPFDPDNEVLVPATQRVFDDCLLESARRAGFLEKFDPAPDPYGELTGRKIVLSDVGMDDALRLRLEELRDAL